MPMTGILPERAFGAAIIAAGVILALSPSLCAAQSRGSAQADRGSYGKVSMVPITLGKKTIRAVVAESEPSRIKGLLGWDRIDDDAGMLLDFGHEGDYAIHMQGMKFPIDAIWIDGKGVIRTIYENIRPDSGTVFPAVFPARWCLEVNAGFCKRYAVKTGDPVRFGSRERARP
jgi:uncharacterized membrane protein (UPF0127 family)